ncbi:MAG: UvrD-helicase domain-containing protein [Lentisphaeria bacterium]
MMEQAPRHQVIVASAGSGKTFQLTNRIIALLAAGVEPERILALTFSRAAAGEIFDTIVGRLAGAAADAAAAAKLAGWIGVPGTAPAAFRELLRNLLTRMHLSPIGTLDSFFVRVLQAFPFEAGTGGAFSILGDAELRAERQGILRGLLRPAAGDGPGRQARLEFMEAVKRATFGKAEKRLSDLLADFIERGYAAFLETPDAGRWGHAGAIWPAGCPWPVLAAEARRAEAGRLREALAGQLAGGVLTDAQLAGLALFCDTAEAFTAHSVLGKAVEPLFLKLLAGLGDLEQGSAEIIVSRKAATLSGAAAAAAARLVRHVVACLLDNKLESTRGVFAVLAPYGHEYDRRLRRAGRLTFADVQYLLAGGAGGPELEARRLNLEYRLDAKFDHWALDEFQDTSRQQWHIIRNLVDEIIQSADGVRSLFLVGDVKQAIYGWRGGDANLMTEILEQYNPPGAPPLLDVVPLDQSQRSSPVVIGLVNRVFGALGPESGLPPAAVERWNRDWRAHQAAHAGKPGHAAFCELPRRGGRGSAGEDAQARYEEVAAQLLALRPWERRLTAAVLVRTNRSGRELVDTLRRHGIPASWAGEETLGDNPAITGILALLKAAAHPADSFAWEQLLMTPLAPLVGNQGETFVRTLLAELHRDGFEPVLRRLCREAAALAGLDPFSRGRLDELLVAAQEFDALSRIDVPAFVAFAMDKKVVAPPAEQTVQVMTIHKSKGLGFDVVFLPDLQAAGIASERRIGLGIHYGADHEPEWVLEMPKKAVAAADPELRRRLAAGEAAAAHEALCVLYVALTRAKHAVTVVATRPAEDSESLTLAGLVRAAVAPAVPEAPPAKKRRAPAAAAPAAAEAPPPPAAAESAPLPAVTLFEDGDPGWYLRLPSPAPLPAPPLPAPLPRVAGPVRARFPRRLPSQPGEGEAAAAALFAPEAGHGREFGSAIHTLFQKLEWWEPGRPEAIVAEWRAAQAGLPAAAGAEMEAVWLDALRAPAIRAALARPAGPCQLWREKSFEVILDGAWVSGAFDRVVVRLDAAGRPQGAVILDYKSNQIREEGDLEALARGYRPQMTLYRQALARILGLKTEAISVQLLFLRAARLVPVG